MNAVKNIIFYPSGLITTLTMVVVSLFDYDYNSEIFDYLD